MNQRADTALRLAKCTGLDVRGVNTPDDRPTPFCDAMRRIGGASPSVRGAISTPIIPFIRAV